MDDVYRMQRGLSDRTQMKSNLLRAASALGPGADTVRGLPAEAPVV